MIVGVSVLAGFYALSQYNYLLFHSLVELLAGAVAVAVFMLFWNARRFMDNSFFLFIGIACLFTGILDVMHVLTYRGTSVFPNMNGDESIQLKTAGRWIAGLSFLVAPLFLRWRLKPIAVLLGLRRRFFCLVFYVAFSDVLPDFYTPEKGMTSCPADQPGHERHLLPLGRRSLSLSGEGSSTPTCFGSCSRHCSSVPCRN